MRVSASRARDTKTKSILTKPLRRQRVLDKHKLARATARCTCGSRDGHNVVTLCTAVGVGCVFAVSVAHAGNGKQSGEGEGVEGGTGDAGQPSVVGGMLVARVAPSARWSCT